MIITEEKYNEELTRYVLPFIRLNFEDGYMKSADGTRIHYGYVTTPVAKAAIVISHGFTECMPKYYEMIYYFAKAGYSVYMVEHRGHGFSERSVSDMSMVTVNSFDDYVSDLDMFIREIVMKREGRRPLYLYGHSMGGAIAALYLEKHPEVFTKAVLSSPMIEMLYGNFHILPWRRYCLSQVCLTGTINICRARHSIRMSMILNRAVVCQRRAMTTYTSARWRRNAIVQMAPPTDGAGPGARHPNI